MKKGFCKKWGCPHGLKDRSGASRRSGLVGFCFLLINVFLLNGCHFVTTKREGEVMRKQIAGLKAQLDEIKTQRKELEEALISAKKDQEKLSEVLESAKKLLLRNSADVGAKVQEIELAVGQILGRLEDLEKEHKKATGSSQKQREELVKVIQALREDLDGFKAKAIAWHTKPKEPEGADALFEAAQKNYRKGVHSKARSYYQKFVDRHPDDPRAERALFNLARSYAKENKFGAAEISLRRFMKQFPKGKLAPKALLLRAKCYQELKYCKNSLALLKKLREEFPKTKEAQEAYERLKRLRRILGNSRYCGN